MRCCELRLSAQLPTCVHDAELSKRSCAAQVLGMMNNPHYLYRMTVLVAVAALAPVVSHDVLCNSMLPVVVAAAKDKVTQTS